MSAKTTPKDSRQRSKKNQVFQKLSGVEEEKEEEEKEEEEKVGTRIRRGLKPIRRIKKTQKKMQKKGCKKKMQKKTQKKDTKKDAKKRCKKMGAALQASCLLGFRPLGLQVPLEIGPIGLHAT